MNDVVVCMLEVVGLDYRMDVSRKGVEKLSWMNLMMRIETKRDFYSGRNELMLYRRFEAATPSSCLPYSHFLLIPKNLPRRGRILRDETTPGELIEYSMIVLLLHDESQPARC